VIDLYCERTAPGLWNEPANVLSNAAFLVAAWAVWRLRRDPRAAPGPAIVLAALAVAIAAGSALFHMLATPRARVFDEAPILLFQLAFLWLYGRRVAGVRVALVVAVMAGLVAASAAARALTSAWNGSAPYVPALIVAAVLATEHARARRPERWALAAGTAVFAAGILCRSIDNAVCAAFPAGTHFVWHLLAAAALYLFARGLVMSASP